MKKVLFVVALALPIIGGMSLAADFNGDGTGDIAIFRDSSGLWAVRGVSRFYFGTTGDLPKPSDWEGDGTDLPTIFRGSSGLWAIRGFSRIYFGSSGDKAKPGDYNGDGTEDIGIFRASSGLWAARGITRIYFGSSGDRAIAPDAAHGSLRRGGLLKTGQSISYVSGDDGTYEAGIEFSYQVADPAGNGDDVVIDNVTGLMWAQNGNDAGCAWGEVTEFEPAVEYCNSLDFAGYTDWRLPNIRELSSLLVSDAGRPAPYISGYFFNTKESFYWSSTAVASNSDLKHTVNFNACSLYNSNRNGVGFVRAVRSGL